MPIPPDLLVAFSNPISAVSCSIFPCRFFTSAECSCTVTVNALSSWARFKRPQIALRARSEMLRAPLATQYFSKAENSSRESLILIERARGIRTAISDFDRECCGWFSSTCRDHESPRGPSRGQASPLLVPNVRCSLGKNRNAAARLATVLCRGVRAR